MAKRVNVVLVDDLDGTDATQTVSFALDGTSYEIDLNDDNAGRLRDTMATFVAHARKVTGSSRARAARATPTGGTGSARVDREQLQAVRDWARRNGHQVNDRGRIPNAVMEAFQAANAD